MQMAARNTLGQFWQHTSSPPSPHKKQKLSLRILLLGTRVEPAEGSGGLHVSACECMRVKDRHRDNKINWRTSRAHATRSENKIQIKQILQYVKNSGRLRLRGERCTSSTENDDDDVDDDDEDEEAGATCC